MDQAEPLARLDELIARALPLQARPGFGPPRYIEPRTPGHCRRGGSLFRALDLGLFELPAEGLFRPRRMRPSAAYCYSLFNWYSKPDNTLCLWREWLTHAAAPAILHLDYGYPLHDIALEIDAFDLLVYSPSNQPYIAIEVKKTTVELEQMLERMQALERLELPASYRKLANYEQKYRSLLALQPSYFLALAPISARSFRLDYPAVPAVRLNELPRIPAATSNNG